MRAQRITRYGVLGGLLAGLACAGNSARTDDTTVAQDTTTTQDPSGYRAMPRDTSLSAVSDSAKANQTKSGASEIKPGESTDTLRPVSDTTAQ
jgi:hypothetical protein